MAEAVHGDPDSGRTTHTGACWVNGRLVGAGDGSVAALDHSIIVGDGVFETMKVIPGSTGGTPFALTRHLQRLRRSADGLGIAPADDAVVRSAVAETLAAESQLEGWPDLGTSKGDFEAATPGEAKGFVWQREVSEWILPGTREVRIRVTPSFGEEAAVELTVFVSRNLR